MFDSVERYLHQLESHPSWPSGPRESGDAPGYYRRRPRFAAPYGKVKVEKIWDENRFLTLTLPFHCMIWTWYESFWVWYNVFYNYFILGRSSNYQLALESGASWMIYGWFPRHPYDIRDIRTYDIYGWHIDDIRMIYGCLLDDIWMIYGWYLLQMIYGWYTDGFNIWYTFSMFLRARPLGRFRSRGLESKVVNSTLADRLGDGWLQLCHGWCLWMALMFNYVYIFYMVWYSHNSKCVTRAPCRRASTMTEMTIRHPTICDKRGGKVHQRPHASARHDKHLMSSKVLSSKPKMMVSQVVVASESLLELDIWKEKENPNNPRFTFFIFHSCRSRRLFTCQALQGSGGWCFWMWWHLTWQEVSCKHLYRSFFCGFLGHQIFKQKIFSGTTNHTIPNFLGQPFSCKKRVVPPPKWHLWLSWIICRL